jgi:hypothetical protein
VANVARTSALNGPPSLDLSGAVKPQELGTAVGERDPTTGVVVGDRQLRVVGTGDHTQVDAGLFGIDVGGEADDQRDVAGVDGQQSHAGWQRLRVGDDANAAGSERKSAEAAQRAER